jgi:hypothetical protein
MLKSCAGNLRRVFAELAEDRPPEDPPGREQDGAL